MVGFVYNDDWKLTLASFIYIHGRLMNQDGNYGFNVWEGLQQHIKHSLSVTKLQS